MWFEALFDLSDARRHSRYFNQTRSHYLFKRVRLIALLLMFIQPAWIAVDYLLLPAEILQPVAMCRGVAALAFLLLALWSMQRYNLVFAHVRLGLVVTVLLAFHLAINHLLTTYGYATDLAGYEFFPFMIISMMAVFPLTLIETIVYVLLVVLVEVITQINHHSIGGVDGNNALWLLSVLGIIAGWAAVNQLNMLLILYRQATRDPLTGLSNRRQALGQLVTDLKSSEAHSEPFSVLLFDLDKFKHFNDNYGHAAGDMVLIVFARLMRKHARKRIDVACRYGGEEFLMMLPNQNLEQAAELAERIRLACHEHLVKTPSNEKIGFTTSVGVAEYLRGETPDELIKRADDALYVAKGSGRDQVALAK